MFLCLCYRRTFLVFISFFFLFILGIVVRGFLRVKPPLPAVFFHRLVLEEQGLSFELPVSTDIIGEGEYLSEEVLFHLAFQDPVLKFQGVLEKWHLFDLEQFLQHSKDNTDLVLSEYRRRETGRFVELFYRQEGKKDTYIGREFFLSAGEGLYYRWAFFLSAGVYRPTHERVFYRIIDSFRFS